MKRNTFAGAVLILSAFLLRAAGDVAGGVIEVDYKSLVSRADLTYDKPVTRSEEGLPVGNGRMGSLVWTTPAALQFQINRVDVFAENSATNSFPVRHSDYASGCGYVDITFADYGDDVFTTGSFRQHLSLYDGLLTVQGNGVTARVLAWPHRDVMAIEVEDRRSQPEPIAIDLRMLRYAMQYHERLNWQLTKNHQVMVRTASHTATSGLDIREGRIVLRQQFREDDYFDASAVAIGVVGRAAKARYQNDSTVRLTAAPGKGRFTILIASAAGFDPGQDLVARALEELNAAAAKGFDSLRAETADWWHDFWSQGFVSLHSADGQADFVEQNYTYFLYVMGASSRGDYPPRFGGMIWYTTGDMRAWGSQYWWANTSAYYSGLMPSNRLELMDPMFSLYSNMYEACARAAVQQWGSKGIWIPETVWFNGPESLPDDIAAEMRDLYLVRKPWKEASARFLEYAQTKQPHYSRWSWIDKGKWVEGRWVYKDKGKGPFGHTSHMLGPAARIASLYWQRWQYTMDKTWLRERAYPMIKGAAEFYRNFPNFKKENDGRYHIHHVNNSESNWDSSDTPYELSCMHTIFPLAVRASEILGVDADLRPVWQEIKDNLVAAPERSRRGGAGGFGGFVYGGPGAVAPVGSEPELKSRFLSFTRLGSFIDSAGIGGAQIFRNRMRLREGPGAIDCEHIGALAGGIHSSLLQSAPEAEGGDPVIQVFPSWPKDWDASFRLLARGAFVVASARKGGQIEFVELQSLAGGECRLKNPWPDTPVTLYRNGKKAEDLSGAPLAFSTAKSEMIVVVPKGATPPRKRGS
jgi:hypothetical protein